MEGTHMGSNISIRPLPLNIPFHNVKSEASNHKTTKSKDTTVDTVKISHEATQRVSEEVKH
jgi:hypothetical protein